MVKLRVKVGKHRKQHIMKRTFSGAIVDKRCPKCGKRMYRVETLVKKSNRIIWIRFRYCPNFRCRYCEYKEEEIL